MKYSKKYIIIKLKINLLLLKRLLELMIVFQIKKKEKFMINMEMKIQMNIIEIIISILVRIFPLKFSIFFRNLKFE